MNNSNPFCLASTISETKQYRILQTARDSETKKAEQTSIKLFQESVWLRPDYWFNVSRLEGVRDAYPYLNFKSFAASVK